MMLGFKSHPDLMAFSESLSPMQKGAMAYAFLEIMTASENLINLRMYNYIKVQFEGIHFKIESNYMKSFKLNHADGFLEILQNLTIEQKGWFLIGVTNMLSKLNVESTDDQNRMFSELEADIIIPTKKASA